MNFYKICIPVLFCIFTFSTFMIINNKIILPSQNKTVSNEIQNIYYSNEIPKTKENYKEKNDTTEKTTEKNNTAKSSFYQLSAINSDIIGWINIPNTVVDYPVLQSSIEQSQYYINRDYNKKSTKYGSIFMDSRCNPIEESSNLTLYGHNMNDGQMFAALLKYDDLEFYKSSPIINFDIMGTKGKWKIISVLKTNVGRYKETDFDYTIPKFESDEDFLNFADNIKNRSIINIPVDIQKDDILITLSTCSYEKKDNRTVVIARKIRENESKEVDVNKAYYNK